jgi:pSer/pThr/pTyr-binding forkhead associated (FHA) protein
MKFSISIFVRNVLRGKKLVSTPCTIGRSKEADLIVAHPIMSRKHCELFENAGVLYLRDSNSLNGIIFKEEYIEKPIPIQIGDEFSVGELTFRISSLEVSPEEQPITDRPTVPMKIEEFAKTEISNPSQDFQQEVITQPLEHAQAERISINGVRVGTFDDSLLGKSAEIPVESDRRQ